MCITRGGLSPQPFDGAFAYVLCALVQLRDAGVCVDRDVLRREESGLNGRALAVCFVGVFDDVDLHRQLKTNVS